MRSETRARRTRRLLLLLCLWLLVGLGGCQFVEPNSTGLRETIAGGGGGLALLGFGYILFVLGVVLTYYVVLPVSVVTAGVAIDLALLPILGPVALATGDADLLFPLVRQGLSAYDETGPPDPLPSVLEPVEVEDEEQDLYRNKIDGSLLVWIPAGELVMGDEERGQLQDYRVELTEGFFLARDEVTWGQFRRFCEATDRDLPPRLLPNLTVPGPDLPVCNVTWAEARDYCRWAAGDLPTEAQWEWAARGQDYVRHPYPWGEQEPGPTLVNLADASCQADVERTEWEDGYPQLAPPGSFPLGLAKSGVANLAGNVAEWVHDVWRDRLPFGPSADPEGPRSGPSRVVRGGSWLDTPVTCSATARREADSELRSPQVGFRLCIPAGRGEASQVSGSDLEPEPGSEPELAQQSEPDTSLPVGITRGYTLVGGPQNLPEVINDRDGSSLVWVSLEPEGRELGLGVGRGFYMGRRVVTWGQYRRFCTETGYPPPDPGPRPGPHGPDDPVWNVTQRDALAYCEWAGLDLPTRAERLVASQGSHLRGGRRREGPSNHGCFGMADPFMEWERDSRSVTVHRLDTSWGADRTTREELPEGHRARDLGFRVALSRDGSHPERFRD
jgi:formylglycine-generating enzyme required for sulfatase activity